MNRWIGRMAGFSALIVCLFLGISQARAVALGKIDVTSHLGEAFFAEIPMQLGKNKAVSHVFAGLATPAEYRTLEVYRDPVLKVIHSEVRDDSRGARVEFSSSSVVNAPFFDLILRVRYGHATQFKKYPVFLNLPQAEPVRTKMPSNVSVAGSQANTGGNIQPRGSAVAEQSTAEAGSARRAPGLYSGWARTGRYGPMVYGDTIRTVALRLRADHRYTLPQVMMALFSKNRKKFSRGNVNLINAGTWLNVPTASEVEEMTPSDARKSLARQMRDWSALKKQPRYTAISEAQKNRYKTRVRMGRMAVGIASVPTSSAATGRKTGAKSEAGQPPGAELPAATGVMGTVVLNSAQRERQVALRQENAALQERLKVAGDKIDALSDKLSGADIVAANARIRKLELSLARSQAELDRNRQEAKARGATPIQWLTYLLGGLVALLLGCVGLLLTRERPHSSALSASRNTVSLTPPSESGGREVSAAEELDQVAVRTDTQESKDALAGHISSSMASEAVDEEKMRQNEPEDTPDSNVDYMAEADIYLRYGMEDEAIDQIKMAIKQHPDHAGAYIVLIRTLQSRGDSEALSVAVEAGRIALSGDELQAFEVAVSPVDESETDTDPVSALPSIGIEELVPLEAGKVTAEDSFEPGFPDMVDISLDIQPMVGKKSGDGAVGDEATSSSIETPGPGYVGGAGKIPDTGLEFSRSDKLAGTLGRGEAPDSLHVDKARSLLAEGALDGAESSFKMAMGADRTRGDALIGLADVAWHRGNATEASEFLAKAEVLVNGDNRDWFESIRREMEDSK